MSGKKSRNKGANGEREFFKLVEEHLGVKLRRNLSQYQEEGQGDSHTLLAGFCLEIKQQEKYRKSWWDEACRQAVKADAYPALCYRLNGQRRDITGWRVRIAGTDLIPELWKTDLYSEGFTLDMNAEAFFQIVRERM